MEGLTVTALYSRCERLETLRLLFEARDCERYIVASSLFLLIVRSPVISFPSLIVLSAILEPFALNSLHCSQSINFDGKSMKDNSSFLEFTTFKIHVPQLWAVFMIERMKING